MPENETLNELEQLLQYAANAGKQEEAKAIAVAIRREMGSLNSQIAHLKAEAIELEAETDKAIIAQEDMANKLDIMEESVDILTENSLPSETLYETEKNELLQQMHTNLTLEELTNLVKIAKGSKKNWK